MSGTNNYAIVEKATGKPVSKARFRIWESAFLKMLKQWNDVSGIDNEWPLIMEEVNKAICAARYGCEL